MAGEDTEECFRLLRDCLDSEQLPQDADLLVYVQTACLTIAELRGQLKSHNLKTRHPPKRIVCNEPIRWKDDTAPLCVLHYGHAPPHKEKL